MSKCDARWAHDMIDTCICHGATTFFTAPGSRCTPLTLAVARHAQAQAIRHFDERSLAFACLGHARATGKPGVFVCTSGTAVANALPAVIEAAQTSTPMLLLTADRPPELCDCGANQSILQAQMFSDYVQWQFNFPVPDEAMPETFVQARVSEAIFRSRRGPVHCNCMFREPFVLDKPPRDGGSETDDCHAMASAAGLQMDRNFVDEPGGALQIDSAKRTAILVGPEISPHETLLLATAAEKSQTPILLDPCTPCPNADIGIRRADLFLGDQTDLQPDSVVHVGGPFVSKIVLQWLEASPPARWVHVSTTGRVVDPLHRVTRRIVGTHRHVRDWLTQAPRSTDGNWIILWKRLERAAEEKIAALPANDFTDQNVARATTEIEAGTSLFLGNSMPIREVMRVGRVLPKDCRVLANRGASGIDGVLATAIGYANAAGLTVLLIGDLSLLHDLNSLSLLKQSKHPVVIVLLNNNGGGIFHHLPVVDQPEFEDWFATPHGYGFEDAAAMFSLVYARPGSMAEFRQVFAEAQLQQQSVLIECQTDRETNLVANRELLGL